MTTIDGALDMLAGCGPEFGSNGLSNHGPMAAEALIALGREEAVEGWVAQYRKRLRDRPINVARIEPERWSEALGDVRRVSDWEDFLAAEMESGPWPTVIDRWTARLAPGLMSAATHGIIRTAHAVRSLAAEDTAIRRAEVVTGLAYWAARYQVLPGQPGEGARRLPSEALPLVPVMPGYLRQPRPTSIFVAVAELDAFEPFKTAIDLATPAADISAFLSDLTQTMAARYLENANTASITYVHSVTAPSALRMLLPYLSETTAGLTARYVWQACAAIHSRAHYPQPVVIPERLPSADELIDRAVYCGDEHAIKFTEACLRENALAPNPAFLAGPLDISGRFGRGRAT